MNANTGLTVFGIDIAKNLLQLHWLSEETGEINRKQMKRERVLEFFANRAPCLIGMEACGGSHYWARELRKLGHVVKLMPGKDVKAFNNGNKDDVADAEAIWAAAQMTTVRTVTVKTEEQQAVAAIHRIRDIKVRQRVAIVNQIRGLMMEFGEVMPQGHKAIREGLAKALESVKEKLPPMYVNAVQMLWEDARRLDEQVKQLENELKAWAKQSEACQRIQEIPGVGLLTATAVVAEVGDAKGFKSGRQLAAFIGLVPRHVGSGGKVRNLGLSKRGNPYIRRLFVHGARSVVTLSKHPPKMVERLSRKHPKNVVIGAMANKLARTVWAVLAHETRYEENHVWSH